MSVTKPTQSKSWITAECRNWITAECKKQWHRVPTCAGTTQAGSLCHVCSKRKAGRVSFSRNSPRIEGRIRPANLTMARTGYRTFSSFNFVLATASWCSNFATARWLSVATVVATVVVSAAAEDALQQVTDRSAWSTARCCSAATVNSRSRATAVAHVRS